MSQRSTSPFCIPSLACLAASLSTFGIIACASPPPEPEAPAPAAGAPAVDDSEAPPEPQAATSPANSEDTWEEDGSETAAPAPAEQHEGREVLYRVSPRGLKVQIEGTEFIPTAEAVKIGGRWGVKLSVTVTTEADRGLLSPARGPLAFGGQVKRGKVETFGDKREGTNVVALTSDGPITFSRTWPDNGDKGLAAGESLELQVGLWGLGPDAETMAPIRRFVVVKMTADQKGAQPVVQPPAN